jgi:hypothetical protein
MTEEYLTEHGLKRLMPNETDELALALHETARRS